MSTLTPVALRRTIRKSRINLCVNLTWKDVKSIVNMIFFVVRRTNIEVLAVEAIYMTLILIESLLNLLWSHV
jgi:hypothetical protein